MFKPLIEDDQPKEEPKAPNYEVLAAEEKVRREAIEARLAEKEKQWEERQAAIEARMRQPTASAAAEPQRQEPEGFDLGMSEEEIAANPGEAMARFQQHLNEQQGRFSEAIQRTGYVMNNLANRGFEQEVMSLRDRDFYDKAEPLLRAYYEQNPGEKVPGMGRSPEEVYSIIIGQNWKTWEQERQASNPGPDPNLAPQPSLATGRPPASYESPISPPPQPAGLPANTKSEKDVFLTPEEDDVRTYFNTTWKTNISKAEWAASREGKVLPKQAAGASDWQVHGRPSGAKTAVDD